MYLDTVAILQSPIEQVNSSVNVPTGPRIGHWYKSKMPLNTTCFKNNTIARIFYFAIDK